MLRLLSIGLFTVFAISIATVDASRPCKDDIAKYCSDIQPGEERIARCISENRDNFSAECLEAITQVRQDAEAIFSSCHDDQKQFCADVEPGQGRIIRCMREHREQLSDQ